MSDRSETPSDTSPVAGADLDSAFEEGAGACKPDVSLTATGRSGGEAVIAGPHAGTPVAEAAVETSWTSMVLEVSTAIGHAATARHSAVR